MIIADIDYQGLATLISALAAAVVSIIGAIYAARANVSASSARVASKEAKIAANESSAASVATTASMVEVKEDVRKVEIATNSMKDRLIEATRAAALGQGEKLGRAEEKAAQKGREEKAEQAAKQATQSDPPGYAHRRADDPTPLAAEKVEPKGQDIKDSHV